MGCFFQADVVCVTNMTCQQQVSPQAEWSPGSVCSGRWGSLIRCSRGCCVEVQPCCQLLFQVCVSLHAELLRSCPILCVSMDCSPKGSSVHGILQERILEWVAMPSSKESSPPRDQTRVSCGYCTVGRFFTTELPGKPPAPSKGPPKIPKWHHYYKSTSFFRHCSDQRPCPFQIWTAETLLGWLEKIQPVRARTNPSESWGCLGYAPELHRWSSCHRPVINVSS